MSVLDVAAALGVLVGGLTQSATGFGFSLVAAPLLFAAAGPAQAVGLLTVLAIVVNLGTLLGEGRRPDPLTATVGVVLLCAVPGMVLGAFVLDSVDDLVLQLLLTVTVVTALVVRRLAPAATPHTPAWAPPVAGLAAGGLTTTTSTAGPPLVLLLLGRDHDPGRIRDTLTVTFLGLSLLAIPVLLAVGTDGAVPELAWLGALLPLALLGQLLGRPLFARLAGGGSYETLLTVVLVASALAGLLTALL